MACFLVPVTEAVITKAVTKAVEQKEKKTGVEETETQGRMRIPFTRKLHWLSNLLLGGSGLLAFEHVWHGEVVPWFPFLTAAENAADLSEMLHEMATVGVTMTLAVTGIWGVMCVAAEALAARKSPQEQLRPQQAQTKEVER